MCVDHRGVQIRVSQQFLQRPDVVTVLERVRRKRMLCLMPTVGLCRGRARGVRFCDEWKAQRLL